MGRRDGDCPSWKEPLMPGVRVGMQPAPLGKAQKISDGAMGSPGSRDQARYRGQPGDERMVVHLHHRGRASRAAGLAPDPGGLAADDLAGALLAERTQVDGGPGTVGPPRLRDFGEGTAWAVPLGDLGI